MNIDLIIKLARLANENPNENEANLAARKVCKLIKAAEYKFNGTTQSKPTGRPTTWNDVTRSTEPAWSSKPPDKGVDFDPFEFLRNYARRQGYSYDKETRGTWETEPRNKDETYQDAYRDYSTRKDEYDRNWGDWGPYRPSKSQKRYTESIYVAYVIMYDPSTREYILSDGTRISDIEYNNNPGKYKTRPYRDEQGNKRDKPKQDLTCTTCGKVINTGFVGPPQVFVCTTCIWKNYMERK